MSIIHEALKKAEREREPRPAGLPRYGSVRMARRRWRWSMTAGMLIGLTTLGAMSTWLWLQSQGGDFPVKTATPKAQDPAAIVLGGEDQTEQQAVVTQPLPITRPLAAVRPSESDQISSPAASSALALEVQATAQTTFERGREAEFTGQWEEAKRYYRQALTLNPTLVEARNNLGTLYAHQRQLTAAIDEFQTAIQFAPNYAIVRNNLGSAYFLIGQEELAIQEFLAALRIDGTYVSPLYNLASLYARRGDTGQAVAFLTRALAIEPAVLTWLQEDPDFDAIKASPEIQRLRVQTHAKRRALGRD
jgi:tetratricopeptide (TPR) repeat protein